MATSKKSARRGAASSAAKSTKTARPTPEPNIARLEKLVRILERSSLTELEYEDKDIVVRLSRGGGGAAPAAPALATQPLAAPIAPQVHSESYAESGEATADGRNIHVVKSPFVGTFYRAPSPDDPAFVEVGAEVSQGQTLCIVEAMKLMNEIESEVAGTIQEILAENGKAVQYGDPLFRIAAKK